MRFLAPAKLNLFLHVVGRRNDGYHLLQSAMTLVDLCDELDLEATTDGRIVLETPIPGVPPDSDLTTRAALLLQQASGNRKLGCRIRLTKRIPMGGGMGGGSSDAATMFIALNDLWHLGLPASTLQQLGVQLGADVPFFLSGGGAWVEGIGEKLTPLPLPRYSYVVAHPSVHVPTATIFGAPELTRNHKNAKIEDFSVIVGTPGWRDANSRRGGESGVTFTNDLQAVAVHAFPVIGELVELASRASFPALARMTGSGSCVFSAFVDMDSAGQAAKVLEASVAKSATLTGTRIHAVQGLQHHPHANLLARG